MTIGEKIARLRYRMELSQEKLAENLGVSRQSVSKWEMDEAVPTIDKFVGMSRLFGVSLDELIIGDIHLSEGAPDAEAGNKYFGTDGFRGEANVTLTSEQAYRVGRFLGWYYSTERGGAPRPGYRARIVIGKDTRRSSYMLEYSIAAGITASGADAYMLHVTTTPSVSYVTRQEEFDCGIMITASHNIFYDNGIKIINRYGEKLDDSVTALVEAYIDGRMDVLGVTSYDIPLATRERIGCIVDHVSGRNRYLGYLISVAQHSYSRLRIGLDCSNGASWMLAKALFGALGAQCTVVGASPDGLNVNRECGSTHIENLVALVKRERLDLGFAFDGDCDRCIAVDERGRVVDGDAIMYILAKRLKDKGSLSSDTVVATVMSNSGLDNALSDIGIRCERTDVGDRFVYERMQEGDYSLGGEQSGHIIMKKYATTGDGLLTAVMLTEEVLDKKQPLSELSSGLVLYPQYTVNVRVKDKTAAVCDPEIIAAKEEIERRIDGRGRVLLRKSGTEPVVRVMVECEGEDTSREYAESVAEKIRALGYGE
ncbi:MAG: phosphoglucosamine mutase [Clostridia bacterium]|nr:phosphoglucosamine mutase [Clostridia bacterium]